MPQPNAVTNVTTSVDFNILSTRAFSTFKILPRNGNTACVLRSRACLADPPAESPSTRYSSLKAGSFSEQSANFPGKPPRSNTPLRRVRSLALRAASRARAASIILVAMSFAVSGVSSRNALSCLANTDATAGCASLDTSLSLVCDENFGSGSFTERIAVNPSRASSPVVCTDALLAMPSLSIYVFNVRVNADLKPARCVPPSD